MTSLTLSQLRYARLTSQLSKMVIEKPNFFFRYYFDSDLRLRTRQAQYLNTFQSSNVNRSLKTRIALPKKKAKLPCLNPIPEKNRSSTNLLFQHFFTVVIITGEKLRLVYVIKRKMITYYSVPQIWL